MNHKNNRWKSIEIAFCLQVRRGARHTFPCKLSRLRRYRNCAMTLHTIYGMVNGIQIEPNIHHNALQFDLSISLPAAAFIFKCPSIQSNREKNAKKISFQRNEIFFSCFFFSLSVVHLFLCFSFVIEKKPHFDSNQLALSPCWRFESTRTRISVSFCVKLAELVVHVSCSSSSSSRSNRKR